MRSTLHTVSEGTQALLDALDGVEAENPVAATRAVASVARRFRPAAPSSWEAFRFTAVQALRPYFEARPINPAKAAAWAVCDPWYGKLERDESDESVKVDNGRDPRAMRVRQALTGGGP